MESVRHRARDTMVGRDTSSPVEMSGDAMEMRC